MNATADFAKDIFRKLGSQQDSRFYLVTYLYIYIHCKIFFPNLAILDIVKIMYSRP